MGVYEDMANDAGYLFGTEENAMMASMLMWEEREIFERELMEYEDEMRRQEILFRKF